MSTYAPILRKAADIYRRNGRFEGEYYDEDQYLSTETPLDFCRVCVLGAINLAAGLTPEGDGIGLAPRAKAGNARQALAEHLGWSASNGSDQDDVVMFLADWHDDGEGSTVDAVCAALLACADADERQVGA